MPNDQKKINRNNRHRGSAFEKSCADLLGMEVVPYSGSNARFGYGDIRDSLWLGECKNITPDENNKVTIKIEWLYKNMVRAMNARKKSFLAWMPMGKPNKYVILDADTYLQFGHRPDYVDIDLDKKHNTKNLILNVADISRIVKNGVVCRLDGIWAIMTIDTFKKLIEVSNMKGTINNDY